MRNLSLTFILVSVLVCGCESESGDGDSLSFTDYDQDSDLEITLDEWKAQGEAANSFGIVDSDNDGIIDANEYLDLVRGNISPNGNTSQEGNSEEGDESAVEFPDPNDEVGDEGVDAPEGGDEVIEEPEGGEEVIDEPEPEPLSVDGVPAPGALCPIPTEGSGYQVGEYLTDMGYKACNGAPVSLHQSACGASVTWIYFTYGW